MNAQGKPLRTTVRTCRFCRRPFDAGRDAAVMAGRSLGRYSRRIYCSDECRAAGRGVEHLRPAPAHVPAPKDDRAIGQDGRQSCLVCTARRHPGLLRNGFCSEACAVVYSLHRECSTCGATLGIKRHNGTFCSTRCVTADYVFHQNTLKEHGGQLPPPDVLEMLHAAWVAHRRLVPPRKLSRPRRGQNTRTGPHWRLMTPRLIRRLDIDPDDPAITSRQGEIVRALRLLPCVRHGAIDGLAHRHQRTASGVNTMLSRALLAWIQFHSRPDADYAIKAPKGNGA